MNGNTTRTRRGKRLAALLLTAALTLGMTLAAVAAGVTTVSAQLSRHFTIVVDGAAQTFYSANGQQAHPIVYQGTTYLPLRAMGEVMGKNVNWDESTLTVSLYGIRSIPKVVGTPDASTRAETVSVQFRPDFTLAVDGVVYGVTDSSGAVTYPMLYSGTIYLPLTSISALLGVAVGWDGATNTVTLTTASTAAGLVTDADSFHQGTGQQTAPATPTHQGTGQQTAPAAPAAQTLIGEEKAKSVALAHAGLASSQVTFVKARQERDDGRQVYDVEFYTGDYKEYDYKIDAYTGTILGFDYDAEEYRRPTTTNTNASAGAGSYIGEEKAKSIALSSAGFTAGQVSAMRCYLERDDGRWEYTVEFYQGATEYDFEIDAYTGTILSRDVDSIYD